MTAVIKTKVYKIRLLIIATKKLWGTNRVKEKKKAGDQQIMGNAIFITSVALPAENSHDGGRGRRGRRS